MSHVEESSSLASSEADLPSSDLALAAQPFVGQWNQLVSTTNWEKGRIICAWRANLIDSSAAPADYADDAWAQIVGGVTGQHVGRLRRVYQRFGAAHVKFGGLYWSHFQAALDWDDAEMWLEGAVQSGWSVAQMRNQRWETLGAIAADQPRAEDIVATELDEDAEAATRHAPLPSAITGEYSELTTGPRHEGPDFGDEETASRQSATADYAEPDSADRPIVEAARPFADLADLPDDVADACERFKLAILKRRREGWTDISCDDLVAALDSLGHLARAPLDDASAPW